MDQYANLREELESALAVIEPQIRGLHDLSITSISHELKAQIEEEIVVRERRRSLIQNVLAAMDAVNDGLVALEADGYPGLPQAQLPPPLYAELQGEDTDLDAAIGVFDQAMASQFRITMGTPEDSAN